MKNQDSLDKSIANLRQNSEKWGSTDPQVKYNLVNACLALLGEHSEALIDAACRKRGIDTSNSVSRTLAAQQSSVMTALWLCGIRGALNNKMSGTSIAFISRPCATSSATTTLSSSDEQVQVINVHKVKGISLAQKIALGFSTLQLHVTSSPSTSSTSSSSSPLEEDSEKSWCVVGGAEHEKRWAAWNVSMIPVDKGTPPVTNGGVAALLGPGNYDCPADILTALFMDDNAVVYKPSPLSTEAGVTPIIEKILEPLVNHGVLLFVPDSVAAGQYIVQHPLVDTWYMTGAEKTANTVLWGSPCVPAPFPQSNEEIKRKILVDKPFRAELGNCSPIIVAPGNWRTVSLNAHARHIVCSMVLNAGHLCAHTQVIYTCRRWKQRMQFLTALKKELEEVSNLNSFYPGAVQAHEENKKHFENLPTTWTEDGPSVATVPFLNDSGDLKEFVFAIGQPRDSPLTSKEIFGPITIEIPLDTEPTVEAFLPLAVDESNAKVHGTLSASVFVRETSKKDSQVVEKALQDLKYGTVGVNVWGLLAFISPDLAWGGYPKGD
eukprot:GHVN01010221.1.p1 GENE.GHVN01010221.1~~GHVN01010221.1.p1  ORF type:complete len:549 (+),score=64.51 GHVN01010221.1:151-1797(+)